MHQIDIDYIEELATDLTGWNANFWQQKNYDEIEWGTMTDDESFYSFGTIDLDTYWGNGITIKMASYIIATKPEVILQLIQRIRELEGEVVKNKQEISWWEVRSPDDASPDMFETEEDAIAYANQLIDIYRKEAHFDGEWSNSVENITILKITKSYHTVPIGNEDEGYDFQLQELK